MTTYLVMAVVFFFALLMARAYFRLDVARNSKKRWVRDLVRDLGKNDPCGEVGLIFLAATTAALWPVALMFALAVGAIALMYFGAEWLMRAIVRYGTAYAEKRRRKMNRPPVE